MKEESSDEFQDLRKILVERLENTWKDLDEDVLEIIDEILHQHGKKKYLPLSLIHIYRIFIHNAPPVFLLVFPKSSAVCMK